MSKNELFLFDALSAFGLAMLNRVPREYHVAAWTSKAMLQTQRLPQNLEIHHVAMDALNGLASEAAKATHVVIVLDAFYKRTDKVNLALLSDAIRKMYDACDDDHTRAFVFVSTGAVYKDSVFPADENAAVVEKNDVTRTALEIEHYLENASADRALKPLILRAATPYGPMCASTPYALFQQATVLSTLRTTVPRFYKGPICPLVHVDDVAAAIYYLMALKRTLELRYNLADQEAMNLGEMFAVVRQTTEIPEYTRIVLPHVASFPWLIRILQKFRYFDTLDELTNRIWKQVAYGYAIDQTPSPSLSDFLCATSCPKLSTKRLADTGFEFEHPSFRTSAKAFYNKLCEDHWIPDLSQPPCRQDALFNRVYFWQSWKGFLIDQENPNTSLTLELGIDNDMPIWATHSFSQAPLRGTLTIGDRSPIPIEGNRQVRHLIDVCSLATASFHIQIAERDLTFKPIPGGEHGLAPYQKFSLVDADGRVRFTGKLTLDITPTTVLKSLKTVNFGVHPHA